MATLNRAVIHHTANSGDFTVTTLEGSKSRVRGTQNWHMDNNGWCDIGYHFMIDKFGNIFEGRYGSMTSIPLGTHDAVHQNSFGFSMLGYFHSPYNQSPPTVMRSRLYDLIAWRMPTGWNPYGASTYNGKSVGTLAAHRDAVSSACPGDIMYNNYITSNVNGGEARVGVGNRRLNEVVVDNSNGGFSVVGTWPTGTSALDKYGSNYRFHDTAEVSQPATWATSLPSTRNYSVYAWWSVGSNRSTGAPYIVSHAGGTSTVYANQQVSGGQWVLLGTWNMNAGSNNVKLSCWAFTGYVVIADAVKWKP